MSEVQSRTAAELQDALADEGVLFKTGFRTADRQSLIIFQRGLRSIGIDESGGIWMRAQLRGDWYRLASGSDENVVILAVGFLATEE